MRSACCAATVCATPRATTLTWTVGSTSNACKEICDGTRNFLPPGHTRQRCTAATPPWSAAARAGFNAADRLWQLGQHDIVLVTENRAGGTSRTTGSDKQTYYKLTSLRRRRPDSVRRNGRHPVCRALRGRRPCLCEAALSEPVLLKLVELGVPFPRNRYGEYIGYKTDHDPRRRATSVDPTPASR